MNENFKKVAQIYLPPNAKPMDMEEYTYRGCKMWVFRRVVKKWRPTANGLWNYRKSNNDGIEAYNNIPEEEKVYYNNEFWMGISDYFLKYAVEFENTVEKEIGESESKEEAKYRLEHFITQNYAELISTENIP